MSLLLKNIHVFDPQVPIDRISDVLIRDGRIVRVATNINEKADQTIMGEGLYAFPGLVDLHVHFRDPGYEHKETIETGIRAALAGGFIGCMPMPNTSPTTDTVAVVEVLLKKARAAGFSIFPCAAITKGREGKALSEMAELKAAGCVALSDDGREVQDALLMRRALEYASMVDLLVSIHAEDESLSKNGYMNESFVSTTMGLRGIPNAAEDVMIARDIELARLTGARIHFQHVSTKRGVSLIREAKAAGLSVSAEATPHHLTLTDAALTTYNTNMKMNPPLRTEEDRRALVDGILDGTIDAIATDHAPHQEVEKDVEFDKAPFGTIGLETALAVILTTFYHTARTLTLVRIIEAMSIQPQRILGCEGLAICKEGAYANIVLCDLAKEWTVTKDALSSKSHNSCFLGQKLKGKVVATICQGRYYAF